MARLSIIIPAYNSARTIEECLSSVRACAYTDYELIVIDDGSNDNTPARARKYADLLVSYGVHKGRNYARRQGMRAASGEIIVNIDSDVLIKADTLSKIAEFFQAHPQADALTGRLGVYNRFPGLFSQYKNLYMHCIFGMLPERATYLYGSIFALRAGLAHEPDAAMHIGEDTEFGQHLFAAGKTIMLMKDLEVEHLKSYSARSFFLNDFFVPFHWSRVWLRYGGIKALGRVGTGFAHAPRWQLAAVAMAPLLAVIALKSPLSALLLCAMWIFLNRRLFTCMRAHRGLSFMFVAVPLTLLDQCVMAAGVASGCVVALCRPRAREK
jgi:hypothetical protein